MLDTCAFLWLIRGDASLSPAARRIISEAENEIYLSSVSAWEIGVKYNLGKLQLPVEPSIFVPRETTRHRIQPLDLSHSAALAASNLPLHHKDPFDRLLVGQALVEGLIILSPDPLVQKYAAPICW